MRRQLISFFGSAALSIATLLAVGPAANAQHRGGFSGGAYHGGSRGGVGGATGFHAGGYNHGYHQGPYYSHGGGGYWGYNRYPGYGGYYPGFGIGIGIGGLGYGGNYNGGYAYSPYNSGFAPTYVAQSGAYPAQTEMPPANSAKLIVRLPADAQLWIDDYQSKQTGPVRELATPATLEPGRAYHYTLKATWMVNGQPVTQERVVNVQAGLTTNVDFTQPASN